jgi:hypothetical protein
MALVQIEESHFKKQYEKVASLPSGTGGFEELVIATLSARGSIYRLLTAK